MRESPLPGQVMLIVSEAEMGDYDEESRPETVNVDDATLITSQVAGIPAMLNGMHKVVIDIDLPAQLIPSSTPGHFHLIIDREMPWKHYTDLLDALVVAGVVEAGYVGAAKHRGYTAVRMPWIRKAIGA